MLASLSNTTSINTSTPKFRLQFKTKWHPPSTSSIHSLQLQLLIAKTWIENACWANLTQPHAEFDFCMWGCFLGCVWLLWNTKKIWGTSIKTHLFKFFVFVFLTCIFFFLKLLMWFSYIAIKYIFFYIIIQVCANYVHHL